MRLCKNALDRKPKLEKLRTLQKFFRFIQIYYDSQSFEKKVVNEILKIVDEGYAFGRTHSMENQNQKQRMFEGRLGNAQRFLKPPRLETFS